MRNYKKGQQCGWKENSIHKVLHQVLAAVTFTNIEDLKDKKRKEKPKKKRREMK